MPLVLWKVIFGLWLNNIQHWIRWRHVTVNCFDSGTTINRRPLSCQRDVEEPAHWHWQHAMSIRMALLKLRQVRGFYKVRRRSNFETVSSSEAEARIQRHQMLLKTCDPSIIIIEFRVQNAITVCVVVFCCSPSALNPQWHCYDRALTWQSPSLIPWDHIIQKLWPEASDTESNENGG